MTRIWLKLGWKRVRKRCRTIARTVLALNKDLWRLDLLSNYCELCLLASGLSHEPNASDGTQIRLQTCLKRSPKCWCALLQLSWLSQSILIKSRPSHLSQLRSDLTRVQLEMGRVWIGLVDPTRDQNPID